MNASKQIIKKANSIISDYCKTFINPIEIQDMYRRLEDIGITTGMIFNDNTSCEWYLAGVEVDNSRFIYKTYKSEVSLKVEYTIYLS